MRPGLDGPWPCSLPLQHDRIHSSAFHRSNMPSKRKSFVIATGAVLVVAVGIVWRNKQTAAVPSTETVPVEVQQADLATVQMTMAEVLDMARAARQHMEQTLDDYTARFVKQELDTSGTLSPESELFMKVQTRLRGETQTAPMRVYLRFVAPEANKGREVAWAEDLNDGQMAVHENYFPLNLKTIWLDPNGIIAMQGQRYPISEIGLVRLVEKLIERGEEDRDNPDIQVTLTRDHTIGDVPAELIQVKRGTPTEKEDDFSLAEISIDPQRQLILRYRSFGWPEEAGADAPLLESYTYHDVKTNVGLTEKDFDPKNPEYEFPK